MKSPALLLIRLKLPLPIVRSLRVIKIHRVDVEDAQNAQEEYTDVPDVDSMVL